MAIDLSAWQVRVESIDIGDMRLYHAYAFNEEKRQVIEGDMEDPNEDYVRECFQQQLMMTLMQIEMGM